MGSIGPHPTAPGGVVQIKFNFNALPQLIKVKRDLRHFQGKNSTVFTAFDTIVKQDPSKTVLYFEDFQMTAEQVQQLSHRVANYFLSQGYKKGDVVGIFMENCAEFVPLWVGLNRVGIIAALINYNLRLTPLKHCIEAVHCKAVIFSPSLSHALKELMETTGALAGEPKLFCFNETSSRSSTIQPALHFAERLDQLVSSSPSCPPLVTESIGFGDVALFIFTSGTTGLPKAASIKHSRCFLFATGCFHGTRLMRSDRIYTSLPLYHGSGTLAGSVLMLIYGPAQVIRGKFSASGFWRDCVKYKATAAQYIGETCRYMLAQPATPLDKYHTVRVMYGNGLRGEIWGDFVERFGVKIQEFYGSTEGNCGMANMDHTIGAVGFTPIYLPNLLPIRLIQVNEETGEPIRNPKTGFILTCDTNQVGEVVGRIIKKDPLADFEGYADKSSTQGKILLNAFRNGDAWFRSGDMMVRNEMGYFYFRDRKGDTFRWKGENCSTTEVESIISTVTGLKGAVVFGVEIPGADGRAGMAAISDPDNSLNLEKLADGVIKSLPSYARPLFVRIIRTELDMTGTYKLKKNEYQKSGFDIHLFQDPVYFFNGKCYTILDEDLYENIISQKVRV
ncbi:Long-chain fatty acid transport protein 4 [Folsomia candida]|uniref:Very long-chain fatty acid transport protein n=1 Tax=Folsomia candida TaxID=158441 RepID=A0A226DVI3_FOLCA|nr:Long-chain fatty acid transport protein 4 [Folsomia candida]